MELISHRLVLFFPGFEPLDAQAHHRRFVRAAEMTGRVWGRHIQATALSNADSLSAFTLITSQDGASTETKLVICDLAPVMQAIAARSFFHRMALGLYALGSFMLNGTLLTYLRTSWRYGLFFLYPLFMLAAILLAGLFSGDLIGGWPGVAAGVAVAAALLFLACRQAHLLLMMDLWHYARVLAIGVDPAIREASEHLVDTSKRVALAEAAANPFDEVIVCGHSIGAALAVRLASELQELETPVHVLTLGSGLLQVACHPKASQWRDMAKQLLRMQVHWLDVQALIDPINFLECDLTRMYSVPSPNYREIVVRMRHLLSTPTYHRIKFNMFRVHRQYVLPVEIRQRFSFHVIISGATAFPDIVRHGGLPDD